MHLLINAVSITLTHIYMYYSTPCIFILVSVQVLALYTEYFIDVLIEKCFAKSSFVIVKKYVNLLYE